MKEAAEHPFLVDPIPMPPWLARRESENAGHVMSGDEEKLRFTIELAVENVRQETGGPFAAAIFDLRTDKLIAAGVNSVVPAKQSWAHAEMVAFAHAQNRLGRGSLAGCVLVSSCEPCAMCSGATPWSGVERLVYGAPGSMAESVGFDEGYKGDRWREEFVKRGIPVTGPLLGEDAYAPFALYKRMNGTIY